MKNNLYFCSTLDAVIWYSTRRCASLEIGH